MEDAEKKINDECEKGLEGGFYLGVDEEGYLILIKELIKPIPEDQTDEGASCGDHKHLFYHERISTKSIEENIDE